MQTTTAVDPLLLAEDVWAHVRPSASHVRDDQRDVVIFERRAPERALGGACRVRFEAATVDARIDEVRASMAARGRGRFTWWLGASTTPDDLEDRLRARGARPDPALPALAPMALDDEPPPAPAGVDVRVISSTDEYRAALARSELRVGGLAQPPSWSDFAAEWELARTDGWVRLGAWVEGEVAAWALLHDLAAGPPFLWGLGGLRSARGRSALPALVRAGWDTAVGLGMPGLVTCVPREWQPALEGMGFRSGPPIHLVADDAGPRSRSPTHER